MTSIVRSAVLVGIEALPVTVEASYAGAGLEIVGLPDIAARETRVRVKSALADRGVRVDRPTRVTITPELPAGALTASLDLAVCLAIGGLQELPRLSLRQVVRDRSIVVGEVSLAGRVMPIRGVLAMLSLDGVKQAIVPHDNANEAGLASGVDVIGWRDVGGETFPVEKRLIVGRVDEVSDMSDVRGDGLALARRAMEIAAAGHHGILFIGEPGAGKTMLARRMAGLVPLPSDEEALEIVRIHSAVGLLSSAREVARPFRAPHHTVSEVGLVGGGTSPRPGEATLAHHGVLFLDELTEFRRSVLDTLQGALGGRRVTVSQGRVTAAFPCDPLLIAAANPTPCGYYKAGGRCACDETRIRTYTARLFGQPIMAHMPLRVNLSNPLVRDTVTAAAAEETSLEIRVRVEKSQAFAAARQDAGEGELTAEARRALHADELHAPSQATLATVIRISRTIADLASSTSIGRDHVEEALSLTGQL